MEFQNQKGTAPTFGRQVNKKAKNEITRCGDTIGEPLTDEKTVLNQISKRPKKLPKRQFKIGDWIKINYTSENQNKITYLGFISGYCYQYPNWKEERFKQGWSYYVTVKYTNGIKVDYQPDIFHESQITKSKPK